MDFFEALFKSNTATGLAIGRGAAVLAPVLVPAVGRVARPVAKTVIKGGLVVYDRAREVVAEAGETVEDLVAEASSEMRTSHAGAGAAAGGHEGGQEGGEHHEHQGG